MNFFFQVYLVRFTVTQEHERYLASNYLSRYSSSGILDDPKPPKVKAPKPTTSQQEITQFPTSISISELLSGFLIHELRVASYELRVKILWYELYFVPWVTSYELHLCYELLLILRVTSYKLVLFYELILISRVTSCELHSCYELHLISWVTMSSL